MKCEAESIGLRVGDNIFLLAGVKELICKDCTTECHYTLVEYSKRDYKEAIQRKEKEVEQ